jgi:hypothetical protein
MTIRITAYCATGLPVDETDPLAARFVVSDRRGRSREYVSHSDACEAADTFRALGGVLLDEPDPVDREVEAQTAAAGRQEHYEQVLGILEELIEDNTAAIAHMLSVRFPNDEAEIRAIGPLSGDRYLIPAETGFDVMLEDDTSKNPRPILTLPRGLSPEVNRMLLSFWDAGYGAGWVDGRESMKRRVAHALEDAL